MQHKTVPLTGIKTADLPDGTFEGWASTHDTDLVGDRVMPGAFKSLEPTVPLLWMHQSTDPRCFVGDVVAAEVPEGLKVRGTFDTDTEFGASAYKQVKARRVGALSIGYEVVHQTKAADGVNELTEVTLVEVSLVSRPANPAALVTSVKAHGTPTQPIRCALAREAGERLLKESTDMMTDKKLDTLVKDRESQLAAVQTILDTADALKQDLTADETQQVADATQAVKNLDEKIRQARHDLFVLGEAKALTDEVGMPLGHGDDEPPAAHGHLAMTGKHGKALAARMVKAMPKDQSGTKALASGQQTTSTIVLPDVVPTGRPAVSVLDVLPTRVVSPSYSFLRQSVRTLNAAPVAEGSAKPTSVVSVIAVENRLRVVAHVSEQIPHYLLDDSVNLERFVEDELVFGLRKAVETEVLAGDGTGEHFTGVLATSGINAPPFATNALTSVRKGLTILDANGYEAGVIVLSAADWETIELLESTSGATDVRGVPIDAVARRLWGVPVVLNQGLGAKVGLVIGTDAVTVDHDGVVDVRWSDAVNDDFTKNFVRCRVEGRFGVSVNQPGAVVKVATAA